MTKFFRDIFWMAWVLSIALIEAVIQKVNKKVYLIIEEECWSVTLRYVKDRK